MNSLTWFLVVTGVLWVAVEILPLSYWRARNVKRRILFLLRHRQACRHYARADDPPHWMREEPGKAWTSWRSPGGSVMERRECSACWVEQRRHFTRRSWWQRRRWRRECFHHEHGGNPANTELAVSWIRQQLIDMGRRKMFWCDEHQGGCGRTWIT